LLESTHGQCPARGLKPDGVKTGLPADFNVPKLKDGIKRFVPWHFVLFGSFVVKKISGCEQRHPDRPPCLAPLMPDVEEIEIEIGIAIEIEPDTDETNFQQRAVLDADKPRE